MTNICKILPHPLRPGVPPLKSNYLNHNTILNDGNTIAWYDYIDKNIEVDANGFVCVWPDKLNYFKNKDATVNGTFDSDVSWTKGVGWSIADGVAKSNNGNGTYLNQAAIAANVLYKLTYTVKSYTSGTVLAYTTSGGFIGTSVTGTGTYVEYILQSIASTWYGFRSDNFIGSIDNVSLIPYSGVNLSQNIIARRPLLSATGIMFNGNSLKTPTITLNQPETIYLVLKTNSWISTYNYMDGISVNSGRFFQFSSTPTVSLYAGSGGFKRYLNWIIGTWAVVTCTFNGNDSNLMINELIPFYPLKSFAGSNNMSGFTLGSIAGGTTGANFDVKEVIIRKVDRYVENNIIASYLRNKWLF